MNFVMLNDTNISRHYFKDIYTALNKLSQILRRHTQRNLFVFVAKCYSIYEKVTGKRYFLFLKMALLPYGVVSHANTWFPLLPLLL